jgi:hypothetical protein
MSVSGGFSGASSSASSHERLFAKIREHRRDRILEVWLYAIGLCGFLALGGWWLTGLARILLPFAAIGVSGGVLGTLLAVSRAREARNEVEAFLKRYGDSSSLSAIGFEIERDPDRWPSETAIRTLTRSIFG